MCNDSLIDAVTEIRKSRRRKKQDQEFEEFCEIFASPTDGDGRAAINGFMTDIELQPVRWIRMGQTLIDSRKSSGVVQPFGEIPEHDYQAYLPYPVFLMGVEIFLKGMWLYQHRECRELKSDSFVSKQIRTEFSKKIKDVSLGHDLLEIIQRVEAIRVYKQDESIARFLKTLAGIIKRYYAPLFTGKKAWANARYPRRYYDDSKQISKAEAVKEFPDHILISRLFAETAERVKILWQTDPS